MRNTVELPDRRGRSPAGYEPRGIRLAQLGGRQQLESGLHPLPAGPGEDVALRRPLEDAEAGTRGTERVPTAKDHTRGRSLEYETVRADEDDVVRPATRRLAQHGPVDRVGERLGAGEQPRRGSLDIVTVSAVEGDDAHAPFPRVRMVGTGGGIDPARRPRIALDAPSQDGLDVALRDRIQPGYHRLDRRAPGVKIRSGQVQ